MVEKITVPTLGESVTEATVSKWLKSQGEKVSADEPLVELETDKVMSKFHLHPMVCLIVLPLKRAKL